MIEVRVTLDSEMSFNLLEIKQFPERVVEELADRPDLIFRNYGNVEGYSVHAGCLRFVWVSETEGKR